MNRIVKEQLQKCSFADLSNFNESKNTYFIKKYEKPKYDIGKCYLIKIDKNIINNPNTLIAINWNNGHFPTFENCKAYVSKILGKKIYVDCLEYNIEIKQDGTKMWSGYLDIDDISQLGEI